MDVIQLSPWVLQPAGVGTLFFFFFNIQIKITQANVSQNIGVCVLRMFCIFLGRTRVLLITDSPVLQLTMTSLFCPSWTWSSHLFISSPHCSTLHKLPRTFPPGSPKIQIPLASDFLWQISSALFISYFPLPLPIPHPSPTPCIFINKKNHLSVPWMHFFSWKWKWATIFFSEDHFPQLHFFTKWIISLSSTCAAVYTVPSVWNNLHTPPTPLMAHTSSTASSLKHHYLWHLVHVCWLNEYLNYIFSTLKYISGKYLQEKWSKIYSDLI